MGQHRCKWVRDQLSLLAGDELMGADRRRVERHLIGCPNCQRHRIALENALEVLHAASAMSPLATSSPSLWPDLSRQIRESRRPVPAPSFALSFAWLRLWPVLAFGLLVAIGATFLLRNQAAAHRAEIATSSRPIAPPTALPASPLESPVPKRLAQTEPAAVEPAPASRYDLDHGTPMAPDAPREVRSSTH